MMFYYIGAGLACLQFCIEPQDKQPYWFVIEVVLGSTAFPMQAFLSLSDGS